MKKLWISYLMALTFVFLSCASALNAQVNINDFIPSDLATHVAVANGLWDDPATWEDGVIPTTGAIVFIPLGITVQYNHASSDHIFAIRVDGGFTCQEDSPNDTTHLKFDTFISGVDSDVKFLGNNGNNGVIVVDIEAFDLSLPPAYWSPGAIAHFEDNLPVKQMDISHTGNITHYGTLQAALQHSNLQVHRVLDSLVANGNGVLGRYSWDPAQLSVGMVTMGDILIEGKEKLNMSPLTHAIGLNQPTNTITINDNPSGWEVGDQVLITRDGVTGPAANSSEEILTISNISGNQITFSQSTQTRHDAVVEENLYCYAGNMTRNIIFQSPENAPLDERGHFMAMNGTKDIRIENASFLRMGRTDKSRLLDDFYFSEYVQSPIFTTYYSPLGREIATKIKAPADEITNMRGRYSVHLHKLGTEYGANLARIIGNVVWDNPGWGITHHDSHADVSNNNVYDILGTGIVAESGSETGVWTSNLVVKVQKANIPNNPPGNHALLLYDESFNEGGGLGLRGRAVYCDNNVISDAHIGVQVLNLNDGVSPNYDRTQAEALEKTRPGFEVDNFPLSKNGYSKEGDGIIAAEAALVIERTKVIFATIGMHSIERELAVNHESRSFFTDFKAWRVTLGFSLEYQASYTFDDIFVAGTTDPNSRAFRIWKHSFKHVFKNIRMRDLGMGFQLSNIILSSNANRKATTKNNGVNPWVIVDAELDNVNSFYGVLLDNSNIEPNYPTDEINDNVIFFSSEEVSPRPITFTILDSTTLRVDYNETNPDNLFRFSVDGVVTDDLGSYNFGIEQPPTHAYRISSPERIYQFASQAKFEEYLNENGVYQHPVTGEIYFILPESIPNRNRFGYKNFPIRVIIDNPPTTGVFANPLVESDADLAPQSKLLSRFATATQSSTKTGITYNDGYSGSNVSVIGTVNIDASASKAIDGNTNGRITAQYYQDGDLPFGSFSETNVENNPWLDLDLGGLKNIEIIDLWNTVELNGWNPDLVSSHFENFYVLISDAPFGNQNLADARNQATFEAFKGPGASRRFAVEDINVVGRYVRVQAVGSNKIKLAEIEVIGRDYVSNANYVQLRAKAFLQGPYDAETGLLSDELRAADLLPNLEPFTDLSGFTHLDGGAEAAAANVLNLTGPDAVVDWVFVELRDENDPAIVLHTRSALLQKDGDIVDVSGTNDPLIFPGAPAGNYYVAVRHRNHLGVMTASPLALTANIDSEPVDFTDPSTPNWGTNAQKQLNGTMLMWQGDANGDGLVKYNGAANDKNAILFIVGLLTPNNIEGGYLREDINMNGQLKYNGAANDKNAILFNVGLLTPNNIITEQLPTNN